MKSLRLMATIALSLTLGAAHAAPPAAPWTGHPGVDPGGPNTPSLCTAPWGVDLCALTGVTTAVAVPTDWGGAAIQAGSWWTPLIGWGTNAQGGILPDFPLTYPDGYVTAYPDDPMQDFVSKLVQFRVVVDPGTPHQRTYEFPDPTDLARVMTIGDYWGPGGLWGFSAINPGQWIAFVPVFDPLSMGRHEIHLVWTLSAEHCDGFPSTSGEPLSVEGGHCIPAGDFSFFPLIHRYQFSFAAS